MNISVKGSAANESLQDSMKENRRQKKKVDRYARVLGIYMNETSILLSEHCHRQTTLHIASISRLITELSGLHITA